MKYNGIVCFFYCFVNGFYVLALNLFHTRFCEWNHDHTSTISQTSQAWQWDSNTISKIKILTLAETFLALSFLFEKAFSLVFNMKPSIRYSFSYWT